MEQSVELKTRHLIPGQTTELHTLEFKLKPKVKEETLIYKIRGNFTLHGISGTLDNSAELTSEIIKTKEIKIE